MVNAPGAAAVVLPTLKAKRRRRAPPLLTWYFSLVWWSGVRAVLCPPTAPHELAWDPLLFPSAFRGIKLWMPRMPTIVRDRDRRHVKLTGAALRIFSTPDTLTETWLRMHATECMQRLAFGVAVLVPHHHLPPTVLPPRPKSFRAACHVAYFIPRNGFIRLLHVFR